MLKQLEKEAEEDEEIYDKMACWCETNDKEKTKAIADAEARISDLTTKIEELTAQSARLGISNCFRFLLVVGLAPADSAVINVLVSFVLLFKLFLHVCQHIYNFGSSHFGLDLDIA
jgi:hypothetical protein